MSSRSLDFLKDCSFNSFDKVLLDEDQQFVPGDGFISDYLGQLAGTAGYDDDLQLRGQLGGLLPFEPIESQSSKLQPQTNLQQDQGTTPQAQQEAPQSAATAGLQTLPYASGHPKAALASHQLPAPYGEMTGCRDVNQASLPIPLQQPSQQQQLQFHQQAMQQQQAHLQLQQQQQLPQIQLQDQQQLLQVQLQNQQLQQQSSVHPLLPGYGAGSFPHMNRMQTSAQPLEWSPAFSGAPVGPPVVSFPASIAPGSSQLQSGSDRGAAGGALFPQLAGTTSLLSMETQPSFRSKSPSLLGHSFNEGSGSAAVERAAGLAAGPALSGGSEDLDGGDGDLEDMELGEDGQPSRNRRHRTLRQQMLNKQAQQRYRERKKAKASDLEKAVAALTNQLGSMEGIKLECANLQDKNLALVSQLRAREEELERMLREQAGKPEYMKTNSGRVLEMAKPDILPNNTQLLQELAIKYENTVKEMRELVSKYGLHNAPGVDIHGAHVPEASLKQLAQMVETVNNIHSRALRMDGANAAGLVTASVDRSSGKHDANRRWAQIAWKMNFTKEQLSNMLTVRSEHLERLHSIYEDRRQVNLEAISVLLPQDRGGTAPSMSVERAKSWLPSMFHRSKHASKQKDVMKKLQDNLSSEQRLASELDYMVFRRILTPVQGCHFVLMKYPAYCDSLSLCNGVAEMQGVFDKNTNNSKS